MSATERGINFITRLRADGVRKLVSPFKNRHAQMLK